MKGVAFFVLDVGIRPHLGATGRSAPLLNSAAKHPSNARVAVIGSDVDTLKERNRRRAAPVDIITPYRRLGKPGDFAPTPDRDKRGAITMRGGKRAGFKGLVKAGLARIKAELAAPRVPCHRISATPRPFLWSIHPD